jgi:hypothetical protein
MDWWRPIISGLVGALVVYLLFRLALAATLVTLFFALASAYLLYEVFLVKLGYDQRFIYSYTPFRGHRTVPWDSPLRQAHYLATRAHGTIWFSPWLNGFAEFVEYVEHRSEMA